MTRHGMRALKSRFNVLWLQDLMIAGPISYQGGRNNEPGICKIVAEVDGRRMDQESQAVGLLVILPYEGQL